MATVKKVNIKIPQGTTYTHEFNYVDSAGDAVDLTGYAARCQLRDEVETAGNFYDATTVNGKMTIVAVTGKVTLTVSDMDSTAFTVLQGFYDVELIAPNDDVTRMVQGKVTIDREITR